MPRPIPPQPPNDVPQLRVVDFEAALERIGGDRQLFRELAMIFVEDSPRLLESLAVSLSKRDQGQAERCAHGLKGIAANIGGVRVERVAVVVEDAARSGQLDLADVGFESLSVELTQLIGALRAMLVGESNRSESELSCYSMWPLTAAAPP